MRAGFDPSVTVEAKVALLDAYSRRCGLKALVIGVSGGVDSALVFALCVRALRRRGAALERVVAALLPLSVDEGATNQGAALARGRALCAALAGEGVSVLEADLGAAHAEVKRAVERGIDLRGDAWAAGQLVSTMRTPALYYATSLLAAAGLPAAVVGTTNRDEGAYLGFFGKASDGMVDIQLIGDLHKSEVYACARVLGVPQSILDAAPTGDTYDGKTDREMIGVSYDEVERYLTTRAPHPILDARHAANAHKYVGDSPAVFLDVHERAVDGGWRAQPQGVAHAVDAARFVAPFTLDHAAIGDDVAPLCESVGDAGASALRVRDLLSTRECAALRRAFEGAAHVAVGVDGRPPADAESAESAESALPLVGSFRASAFSEPLAAALWARLAPLLPSVRVVDELTPTDHGDHPVWRAVGVNPLFRFMQSAPGGFLVPHTDSTYDRGDGRRTLMSVILALDDGGATHLLVDPQRNVPVRERVFVDGRAPARASRVLTRVTHERGAALILDHRVPHEGAVDDGRKILVRTDVMYERCAGAAFRDPAHQGERCAGAGFRDPAHPPEHAALANARRDPFYAPLSDVEAVRAGWFDDGRSTGGAGLTEHEERDPRWLVTPLHKLRAASAGALDDESLADPRPLVALVTTGALCPVHRGHIELMERAREALLHEGYAVAGGWLAPDHDRYVRAKCGADAVDAGTRIRLCEEAVADSDWLMVDPWAALHVDRAVNFTDVILRLERVLAHHVRSLRPIRVAYVFGSDNARFAGAFRHRGLGVCVPRPGHDGAAGHARGNRVVVARTPSVDASSSAVRAGADAHLPPRVRNAWTAHRAARSTTSPRPRIHLRDEGAWAVAPWLPGTADVVAAYARFRDGVVAALQAAFPDGVDVELLDVAQQRARLRAALRAGERTLSLDPCIPGDAGLAVSRCFDVGARDARPGLVARPGSPALAVQLSALPAGDFVLVDDDSVSGTTLAAVRAILPPDVRITRELPLCDLRDTRARDDVTVDLVDCRDFLAGAKDAGLVLALPSTGDLVRAPYVFPYARPADRSSIPLSSEAAFSRAIWELNARFFDDVAVVRVRDASAGFRALCAELELDLDGDTDMRDVCAFHLRRLAGV